MTQQHTILVVDDHPLFRDALRQAIGPRLEATIVEAEDIGPAHEALDGGETDLVLLDLNLPGVQGLSGLSALRGRYPDVPIVIVSASEEPALVRRCLKLGAAGYIPKSLGAGDIAGAIEAVLGGDVWTPPGIPLDVDDGTDEIAARLATLTPQQARVLVMLGEGLLNKQIAYQLTVSEATVKAHVSAILQKLNVDSRTQAVIRASKVDTATWRDTAEV
ncbi:MAG: response regulator transcription factor [Pseudomonadota bacterium]